MVTLTLLGHVAISEADVVFLKNGDRVSGDLITMEDTVLTVDTDYADIVKIDWDDVAGLTSDSPLWVAFHDGAIIPDDVGIRDGGRLILFGLEAGVPIQLDKIKTIHLFELSYRGNIGLSGSATSGNTSTETINAFGTLTVNKGASIYSGWARESGQSRWGNHRAKCRTQYPLGLISVQTRLYPVY